MGVPDVLARGAGGSESLRVRHHDGGGFRARRRLHGGRREGRDDAPQATAREPSPGRQADAPATRCEEAHARGSASATPTGGSEAAAPGGSHRTARQDRAPGPPARGAGSAAHTREGRRPSGTACRPETRARPTSGGGEERACQGGPDAEGKGADAWRPASRRAAPTRSASNGAGRASGSPTRVGALGGRVGLLADRHRHRSGGCLRSVADGVRARAGTAAGHSRRARSAEADRNPHADSPSASHAEADADADSVLLSLDRDVSRSHEARTALDRDIERSEPAVLRVSRASVAAVNRPWFCS